MRPAPRCAGILLFAVLAAVPGARAQAPAGGNGASKPAHEGLGALSSVWKGDLDVMFKRRTIRALVVPSKMFYFVDRGRQRGATYEAMRLFEKFVNKKLKTGKLPIRVVFLPVHRDQLIPALLEGRGDIAAANLGVTPERRQIVDMSDPIRRDRDEILVTGPASAPIGSLAELSGREVYVRKSTSYYENLERLNATFQSEGKAPVRLRLGPEDLQEDDILEMLNAGLVKNVVVDELVAKFWGQIFPKIRLHPEVAVARAQHTAWMIRKNSPKLKAIIDECLEKYPEGSLQRNLIFQEYLRSAKWVKSATSDEEMEKFERTVELFRKYGGRYNMDYLLMIAQAYQESELNQDAKSRVGAIGVMQLMPATGREMDVGDIRQIDPNVHAGVKYVRFMVDRYYAKEPMTELNKGLFAFASYNAGPARIQELRRIAASRRLDPNVWFENVEIIAAERIGRETIQYVSNIYKYYTAYKLVAEDLEERRRALEELKKKAG